MWEAKSRTRLTIFDCDGTLVDSEGLGNEVLVELAGEHGIALGLEEAVRLFRGMKMAECVAVLDRRLGEPLPESFVPRLRKRMTEAFGERLRPIAGAHDLLRSMTGPMCVASSGPSEKIRHSLQTTGLSEFFGDGIFSSYDIGSWKPDPEIFLHAARCMGASPEECNVVEDSLLGIRAGVAAGMRVFAYQPGELELGIPAGVRVVTKLSELEPLLSGSGTFL